MRDSRALPGCSGHQAVIVLLEATARGEHGAFDLLYEHLSVPVYNVIRAVLRNRAQAEEVFLEVWQVASRYDAGKGGTRRCRPWTRLRGAMLDGAAATSGLGHAVISGLGAGAEAAQAPAGIAVAVAVP